MLPVFEISEEDIAYAESVLLPEGKVFDTQRRAFIRNFETIDLQAVPGSGKTTALLAKLLILERKLPFEDGSGILVISHTNVAIDEIKERIHKYCPRLFSYPNFIGTIQSFVDNFLAIPYYSQRNEKKPVRIDNGIYNEQASKFSRLSFPGFSTQENNNAKRLLRVNDLFKKLRYSYINDSITLTNGINGAPVNFSKPKGNTRPANYTDWSEQEKIRVKEWLKAFKNHYFTKGIISFDDAYFLAERYMKKFPPIKEIIQRRFSFVFVDEMQDMDKHQYDILETLFFDSGNAISIYQRIGDKNQSIFNGDAKTDVYWLDRETILPLNGSQRLSPTIANVVNKFALHRPTGFQIVGLMDGTIKPHIITYSSSSIKDVIPKFLDKISELVKDPENINFHNRLMTVTKEGTKKYPIKVIAWNSVWTEETQENDKVRLIDYFDSFSREVNKPKQDYPCLKDYLICRDSSTFKSIQKNIINALLRIIRFENIQDIGDRNFTQSRLLQSIKDKNEFQYTELKLKLYEWSIGIIQGNGNLIFDAIKDYIPVILTIYGSQIDNCQEFITSGSSSSLPDEANENIPNNTYTHDGFVAEIATVHSAKGQTHSATLYLESYYQADGTGANTKSYESQRLAAQFLGTSFINSTAGKRVKQSAKMAYVGLSRPTDFLCVAIHRDRFNAFLNAINREEWEIIDINQNNL